MQPKFSIIIPIYNTSKEYVKQCLDSIINQSYQNWEWGDDNRLEEDYSELLFSDKIKYTRLEKNMDIFFAYKHPFNLFAGEYIIHCDSYDWLDEGYLQKIIKNLDS